MSGSPSQLPVIAFTVACGEEAMKDARLCAASFRYWHPDVPFLCLDDRLYPLLTGGQGPASIGEVISIRALAGWFLSRHAQRVICVDADLFVLGRLEALLDPAIPTAWTLDWGIFTMGVPEAPRLNSGVLASSDPAFWPAWTAAQYSYLAPAVERVYFDQVTLRLLAMAGAVQGKVIDGRPGEPYYNVSIGEQPGDWRVEGQAVYKGVERALIFHFAGQKAKGISAAPLVMQALLEEITRDTTGPKSEVPAPDLAAWWEADGASFSALVRDQFARWPISTLEAVVPDVYAATPGFYRTVAPLAYDRDRKLEGTGWSRIWKREWQAYLYMKGKS